MRAQTHACIEGTCVRTCVCAPVRACAIVHKLPCTVQNTAISNAYTRTQGRVAVCAPRNSAPDVIHGAQCIPMCLRERGGGGVREGVACVCMRVLNAWHDSPVSLPYLRIQTLSHTASAVERPLVSSTQRSWQQGLSACRVSTRTPVST